MIFEEIAQKIVEEVFGAVGLAIMGRDGIPLTIYLKEGAELDMETLGVEYANLLAQLSQALEKFGSGNLEEISLLTDRFLVVIRNITPDYFICLILSPDGNFGKARYLLRVNLPRLREEL